MVLDRDAQGIYEISYSKKKLTVIQSKYLKLFSVSHTTLPSYAQQYQKAIGSRSTSTYNKTLQLVTQSLEDLQYHLIKKSILPAVLLWFSQP